MTASHPARRSRIGAAVIALLVGCVVGAATPFAIEIAFFSDPRLADLLFLDFFVVLSAASAWSITALPLALFGSQRGWFFQPLLAPAIGAVFGVALMVLEFWLVFDVAPWDLLGQGVAFQEGYFLFIAGLTGAAIWTTYTWTVRRSTY